MSESKRRQRRHRRKKNRPRLIPADTENDVSRQRGWLAGFREVVFKRYHRYKKQ